MRAIGIDPGTISIDVCGLDDGRVFLDASFPTADVVRDPSAFVAAIESAGPVDLIAGPSGYGLPLVRARDLTDIDLRLAFLAAPGEGGGIGGMRALARALTRLPAPVVFTPAVIHLASVPAHRKVNRVDMGTADKVAATVLALYEVAARRQSPPERTSFILLELGGAFTAAVAVDAGRIVDGMGGSSGPLGMRAAGALDGEVAFLAGAVSKDLLFGGGALSVAGTPGGDPATIIDADSPAALIARAAYVEGLVKAVAALRVAVPAASEVVLSGRVATLAGVRERLADHLAAAAIPLPVTRLEGFAAVAKHAAQGAAITADGLAGGRFAPLIAALDLRAASGTVLDHLHVISADAARARLGL